MPLFRRPFRLQKTWFGKKTVTLRGRALNPAETRYIRASRNNAHIAYKGRTMIVTLLIGFVIGVLAKFLYPGRERMGIIMTTLLGIGGSVLGSWAGQVMGWYAPGQPAGWIVSTVAAVVILAVYNRLAAR